MKVMSIDVGIKNLACCLLEKKPETTEFDIVLWECINLTQQTFSLCCEKEPFKDCMKPAKFIKDGKTYCLKHAKKQPFHIPTSDLKLDFLKKQTIKSLYEIAEKYKIPYEQPMKKANLLNAIHSYIFETCFQPIVETNASALDLITIGKNMKMKFDSMFANDNNTITHVIIENQISPIANRMKTLQGMIAQYFIMKNSDIHIEFISASNKLKLQSDFGPSEKLSYSERKKKGIQQCLDIISTNSQCSSWEPFFKTHVKKDDLADAFLQGVWFITKKGF